MLSKLRNQHFLNHPHLSKSLLAVILESSWVNVQVMCEAEVGIVMSGRVVRLKWRELLHLQDGRGRTRGTNRGIPILLS